MKTPTDVSLYSGKNWYVTRERREIAPRRVATVFVVRNRTTGEVVDTSETRQYISDLDAERRDMLDEASVLSQAAEILRLNPRGTNERP